MAVATYKSSCAPPIFPVMVMRRFPNASLASCVSQWYRSSCWRSSSVMDLVLPSTRMWAELVVNKSRSNIIWRLRSMLSTQIW